MNPPLEKSQKCDEIFVGRYWSGYFVHVYGRATVLSAWSDSCGVLVAVAHRAAETLATDATVTDTDSDWAKLLVKVI